MPFTSQEKAQILQYLGYSIYEDDGPAMRSLHSMDSRETNLRPLLAPILTKIAAIDCEIQETTALAVAIRDGSVEMRAHYALEHLCNLGKMQIARLCRLLKVRAAPDGDYFSSALPGANFYSGDPSEHRVDPMTGTPTRHSGGGGGHRW